jgi:8-oxo-dGTP pyrophosphatase MutT (NUDIX family)
MKLTTCGVLVTDGARLLLGHATRSSRWDIPKGVAEPGEELASAAVRELREETGLDVSPSTLTPLGIHPYLPRKQLALFEWRPGSLPDPKSLHCTSQYDLGGKLLPEFDHFGIFEWRDAVSHVGRNMARVLSIIQNRCCGWN